MQASENLHKTGQPRRDVRRAPGSQDLDLSRLLRLRTGEHPWRFPTATGWEAACSVSRFQMASCICFPAQHLSNEQQVNRTGDRCQICHPDALVDCLSRWG